MIRALVLATVATVALAAAPASAIAAGGSGDGHGEFHGPAEPPPVNWIDFGFKDKDVHGGELEKGEAQMSPPFAAVIINFLLFLALLIWKAGPPLARYLRNRHDSIRDALDEAGKAKVDAEQKLVEYGEQIKGVDGEVDELVKTIRDDAAAEQKYLLSQADAQAASLRRDTDDRIEAAKDAARAAVEAEVTRAAVAAAEKILRDKATAADSDKLVDAFIERLIKGEPPKPPSSGGGGDGGGGDDAPKAPLTNPRQRSESSQIDGGW